MRIAICAVCCMCALLVGNACASINGGGAEPEIACDDPIGDAKMDPDGTIVVLLYASDPATGAIGQAQFRYPPSHERYQKWLDHLGDLEPGQEKLVCPWPEASTEVTRPQLDQAAFRATIDRMRGDFMAAADSGKWESAASILDPEVVMVVPGGEDWAVIKAASELPYPPGTQLDITPVEVRQLSPDWGYELGTNVVTWTPEGADEPTTLTDTYLVLFRRGDEGWKLYREVASAGALPEPPA